MPSFKVPCPSCEAQVLIKNPNLIGTKVECPKCKYRFKVEEPVAEGGADDKAKKKDKDAAKPKKKKKSNATAILAVVAGIAVLAGVGYFVVGGKKKEVAKGPTPGPRVVVPSTGGDDVTDQGKDAKDKDDKDKDGKDKKKASKPVYVLSASDKDPTNLLPGQSVAVYRFNMEQIRQSPTFNGLFDSNADLFKTSMGFDLDNVAAYFHCVVGADRGSFGVMRLTAPVGAKETAAKMSLEPGPKMVKDRALHTIKSNPFVTAVGQTLAARSVLGDVYETMPGKPAAPAKTGGVCFYDTQTIMVGDLDVVDQFLAGLKGDGYPEFKSVLADADGKTTGKGQFTSNPSYRTVDVMLKRNLNAVDADPESPPMIVFAELLAPNEYDPKLFKKHLKPIGDVLDPVLRRARSVGMNLSSFTAKQFTATVRIVTENDAEARAVANEHLTPGLTAALPPLALLLGAPVELRNGQQPATPGTGTGPGLPGTGTGGQLYPGMSPMGNVPPRGGSGGTGSPDGGDIGSLGGGGGGLPPRGSGGGPPRGMQPPMGSGGGYPGDQSGQSGQPTPPVVENQSFVELKTTDNVVTVSVTVYWTDDAYRRTLGPRLVSLGNQTKGKMGVYAASYAFFPLAEAVKAYTEKYKAFPRGTSDRPIHVGVGLPYPPSKRVSFFSELLPFMERSKSLAGPDRSLGWAEEKVLNSGRIDKQGAEGTPPPEVQSNLPAAELWVPELLVPYYPAAAWRATSPLAPDKVFGGTNFVAIAGIGVEAARLDLPDPAAAKKAGITGYAWGSKVEEVTDGLANTIYLMQVPPGLSRPWAAGGGATVMGLNEKDPMADFVHTRPDGEKGAYAIMGDGAVRWISAKIDPKHFLAMSTRAGGETLPPIETIAPKIELKKAEEPKVVAAEPVTPPVGKQPAKADAGPLELAPPPREKTRN